jgi:hypothetical protein
LIEKAALFFPVLIFIPSINDFLCLSGLSKCMEFLYPIGIEEEWRGDGPIIG